MKVAGILTRSWVDVHRDRPWTCIWERGHPPYWLSSLSFPYRHRATPDLRSLCFIPPSRVAQPPTDARSTPSARRVPQASQRSAEKAWPALFRWEGLQVLDAFVPVLLDVTGFKQWFCQAQDPGLESSLRGYRLRVCIVDLCELLHSGSHECTTKHFR